MPAHSKACLSRRPDLKGYHAVIYIPDRSYVVRYNSARSILSVLGLRVAGYLFCRLDSHTRKQNYFLYIFNKFYYKKSYFLFTFIINKKYYLAN